MQAITQDRYGSAEVMELTNIDKPETGDGEVLVRVHAASIHVGDWILMTGVPYVMRMATGLRRPKNRVPGTDIAGTVEAVGKDVQGLRPGDEVFGWCTGAFAEYAPAPEDQFVKKPANLTFEQAAAVGVSATTALQLLRDDGNVQPGQKVLINGASGGVGTFAVQIAKAFGAEVTGVSSTKNVEMVRSIGADHVIDYTTEDFTKGGPHYDLILDNVGNHSMSAARRALTPNGTLLSNGGGHADGKLGRTIRRPSFRCSSASRPGRPSRHRTEATSSPSRNWSKPARSRRSSTARTRSTRPARPSLMSQRDTPAGPSSSRWPCHLSVPPLRRARCRRP